MSISPISYGHNNISMRGLEKPTNKPEINQSETTMQKIIKNPVGAGVTYGLSFAGIGFGFDRLFGKLFGANNSIKSSVILNGIIGLGMGLYTGIKVRNANKASAQNA
jgi:hypothetical protein